MRRESASCVHRIAPFGTGVALGVLVRRSDFRCREVVRYGLRWFQSEAKWTRSPEKSKRWTPAFVKISFVNGSLFAVRAKPVSRAADPSLELHGIFKATV